MLQIRSHSEHKISFPLKKRRKRTRMKQVQTESTACHWFMFLDDRPAGRDSPINSSIDRSIMTFFLSKHSC